MLVSNNSPLSTLGRTTVTFTGAALFAAVLFVVSWYYEIAALPDTVSLTDVTMIYAIAAMAISQIMFGAVSIGIALTSLHVNTHHFM